MPTCSATPLAHAALYEASVPVCLRFLERLDGLVVEAGHHARATARPEVELLHARLAPDMHPFAMQVMITAHFAQRLCCPLAGHPVPAWPGAPGSLEALRRELELIRHRLAALPAADFDGAEDRVIAEQAGDAELALPAWPFLVQYGLPNFFFHLSMAYAILRQLGAPVGKAHFDGWHAYPAAPKQGAG